MPGCFMAAVRHNRPTIIVYGGTIQAGVRHIGMLLTRYEHPPLTYDNVNQIAPR